MPATRGRSHQTLPRRRGALFVLGALGFLLLWASLALWLRDQTTQAVAERIGNSFERMPENRLPEAMRQALDLGPSGLRVVIGALDSPGRPVALAAFRTLAERAEAAKQRPTEQALSELQLLATLLVEESPAFSRRARESAASLAQLMLLWLPEEEVVDSRQLVAACEMLIRASIHGDAATDPDPRPSPGTLAALPTSEPRQIGRAGDVLPQLAAALRASPPSQALAIDPYQAPRSQAIRQVAARSGSLPPGSTPGKPAATRELASADQGPAPAPERSRPNQPETIATPRGEPTTIETRLASERRERTQAAIPDSSRDTVELMRELHAAGPESVAARRELARRGFGTLELEMARRLTHPDPDVRRDLGEWLPRLPNIDARPWLFWLSQDESPRVRLIAASQMATSSDPRLLERVEAMYQGDPDAAVKKQAGRLQAKLP